MYTKEDFNKVWKDSSREDILNQFYYEHKDMEKFKNIINELEKDLLELRLTDVPGRTIVYRLLDTLRKLKGNNND